MSYVPDAGDLVWVDFDPHAGREQAGRRPALVLSPKAYNAKAGLALMCPITSHQKGYPFEVAVEAARISGVILVDQVKSVDWKVRRVERITACPASTIEEVRQRLAALLGL